MTDIALVGAGQLGSRHLQALAQFDRPATVWVVDPSPESLAVAKERFGQVAKAPVSARFVRDFGGLPKSLAAAVVATGANVRRAAVESLLAQSSVEVMLLEKVLFQRIDDYAAVGTLLKSRGVRAWVNCAQRLWPFFVQLRERTLGRANVHIGVSGANWGLGCNAIHNLDLLEFMTGAAGCRIEAALDPGSVPSKRPGFIEFTGTLYAFGPRGGRVVQTSHAKGDAPFSFDVEAEDFRAHWRVGEPNAHLSDAQSGWAWREHPVSIPYQSQLTHLVVAQMLDKGTCVLPLYDDSARLHVAMLEAFFGHMERDGGVRAEVCAIT